jgi:cyclic di-GMP phosphodiesterase
LMSSLIAEELGMPVQRVDLIRRTAPLHDIGKIGVPDSVLNKSGRLTSEEFELIKSHTVIGQQILDSDRHEVLRVAGRIARGHHEKWDGTGYPDGLSRESIPIEARIVALADAFDVLTHARRYKEATPPSGAMAELTRCTATHFDPAVVSAFTQIFARVGFEGILAMSDPIDPRRDLV